MTTPIIGLPELDPSQNQKYLTVNQSFRRIDALINLNVLNMTQTAPPGSPTEGDRYVVAATATGAFLGQENNLAIYIGTAWVFHTPTKGWRLYDQATDILYTYTGTAWTDMVKFSMYETTTQAYVAGAWRDLLMGTARHNVQSAITLATKVATFTAPSDGFYAFGVGSTYSDPGTTPTKMQIGLSVNSASPTGDRISSVGSLVTGESSVSVSSVMDLTSGDTVNPKIFMTTNDGEVLANENYFWGYKV